MFKILQKNIGLLAVAGVALYVFGSKTGAAVVDAMNPTTEVDPYSIDDHTISTYQAASFAASLYDAMEGMGTDEDQIWNVFSQMKSRGDYNMVYNEFQKRQYSRTFGNMGDPVTSSNYDLTSWLNFELSLSEKEKFAKDFPFVTL